MTDDEVENEEIMSPCFANSDGSGVMNFIPLKGGAIKRLAARQNAVCISYVEDIDEEGEPYLRRYIWVECKDMDLKDQLLEKAREIVRLI